MRRRTTREHADLLVHIREQLIAERLAAGLTQEALADRMGVPAQTVTLLESGHGDPYLKTVVAWAFAFGYTLDLQIRPVDADC